MDSSYEPKTSASKMMNLFRDPRGYIPLSQSRRSSSSSPTRLQVFHIDGERSSMVKFTVFTVAIILFFTLGYFSGRQGNIHQWKSWYLSSLESPFLNETALGVSAIPPKPSDVKVVGLVFYGRREYVNVLDCYLQKNLAVNGGYLDSVTFLVHTEDEEDIAYLDQLVDTQPAYEKVSTRGPQGWAKYKNMWNHAQDPDTIYVKIDDDVVYIHQEAIPRLVNTLISRPDAYAAGANTVNNALFQWIHWHTGAIHPFVPEQQDGPSARVSDWRVTNLPRFKGDLAKLKDKSLDDYEPKSRQRFLRLPDSNNHLSSTPIAQATYENFGISLRSWQMAGQAHYSLFQNIEQNTLDSYVFSPTWNMQGQRYSINFIAIRGRTVAERPVAEDDDEREISVTIPKELDRPFLIDSRAIVSHFAYHPQWSMRDTDILERYLSLGNEMVCGVDNQKTLIEVERQS